MVNSRFLTLLTSYIVNLHFSHSIYKKRIEKNFTTLRDSYINIIDKKAQLFKTSHDTSIIVIERRGCIVDETHRRGRSCWEPIPCL